MKRPRIKSPAYGWCVVDTDGSLLLGLLYDRRSDARVVHPMRHVVPVRVTALARMPKRRGRR